MAEHQGLHFKQAFGGALALILLVFGIVMLCGIINIGECEQLVLIYSNSRVALDGPASSWVLAGTRSERRSCYQLTEKDYLVIEDIKSGLRRIQKGPGQFYLDAYEQLEANVSARTLSKSQWMVVLNELDGNQRVVKGPQLVFPENAHESLGDAREGVDLNSMEYLRVTDTFAGQSKVVKGPLLYFPETAHEQFDNKEEGVLLTEVQYMEVTDKLEGSITIVQGPQLYMPSNFYQSAGDVRNVVQVEPWEVMLTRDRDGNLKYHYSHNVTKMAMRVNEDIVSFTWSAGADMEQNRTYETFEKLDLRVQMLPFFFDDIRSYDNMEFELEGVIFWQVEDVPTLLHSTADPTADIWHHLRARMAAATTGYSFLELLENASDVKAQMLAHELENSSFYSARGVKLHAFELLEVELHNDELAKSVSDGIAEEALKRLNQVQQQETQNSVELVRAQGEHQRAKAQVEQSQELDALRSQQALQQAENQARLAEAEERNRAANALLVEGNELRIKATQQNSSQRLALSALDLELELEQRRVPLLAQLDVNARTSSGTAGAAAGIAPARSASEYLLALQSALPDLSERLTLYKELQELQSRNATTANLAGGSANLIVSPESVGLSLGGLWNRTEL